MALGKLHKRLTPSVGSLHEARQASCLSTCLSISLCVPLSVCLSVWICVLFCSVLFPPLLCTPALASRSQTWDADPAVKYCQPLTAQRLSARVVSRCQILCNG